MQSRIVKAIKNAKSSLKSHETAVEEPEIVAVIPPPQDPKRSQPPPTPPAVKDLHKPTPTGPHPPQPRLQPSPPPSPIARKFEETRSTTAVPEFTFLAELPDTSIARPKSQEEKKENRKSRQQAPGSPMLESKEGGVVVDEHVLPEGLGKELKEKKKKDPAVLVEIPKSPSAQAYEVAHNHKLQDQYFDPVFEDESRTPREGNGTAPPSAEKVAETLKTVVIADPTSAGTS